MSRIGKQAASDRLELFRCKMVALRRRWERNSLPLREVGEEGERPAGGWVVGPVLGAGVGHWVDGSSRRCFDQISGPLSPKMSRLWKDVLQKMDVGQFHQGLISG